MDNESAIKTQDTRRARGSSLQDPFLEILRRERIPTSIYLANGIKLVGEIDSIDQYSVMLKNATSQIAFKHAISTIAPARDINLTSNKN